MNETTTTHLEIEGWILSCWTNEVDGNDNICPWGGEQLYNYIEIVGRQIQSCVLYFTAERSTPCSAFIVVFSKAQVAAGNKPDVHSALSDVLREGESTDPCK